MAGANGTAAGTILRLGSLVPERVAVTFDHEVLRGGEMVTEEVVLQAFVYGPRCPAVVKAECAAAEDKRREAVTDPSLKEGDRETAVDNFIRAYIIALVPGIAFPDADMLVADRAKAVMLLRGLHAIVDQDPGAPAEGDGETEEATPLTTAPSSPISSPAMAPTTT